MHSCVIQAATWYGFDSMITSDAKRWYFLWNISTIFRHWLHLKLSFWQFLCSQWRQCRQNENISISVMYISIAKALQLVKILYVNSDIIPRIVARLCGISLWRHQMETFSALLAICAGNAQVPGEFPTQRPVTWIFDVFFDLRLNKRLGKQWWGWWFETLSRPLWRHCNVYGPTV